MSQQSMSEQSQQDPSLDDVIITDQLESRPRRAPNLLEENQALHLLAHLITGEPQTLLDKLVTIACELCHAGSAGVSVLTTESNGNRIFKWVALAGAWESYVGGSTPADFSPCGICLARGTPQLFALPARYFTYFNVADPPLVEGLVIPLSTVDGPIGTIWIVAHDGRRHFDSEDVRIMTSLAGFTADGLRTIELVAAERHARDEAEDAVRIRDEFLVSMAHDLKGPLTTIKGTAQLLQRQVKPTGVADIERLVAGLGNIDTTATRMAAEVDELIDLARLQTGQRLDLHRNPINLIPLVQRIADEPPHSDRVRVDVADEELVATCDEVKFERVLNNLLSNAVKYSPDGSDIRVTLRKDANGEAALLTVQDDGVGIPAADLPYVFERFRRGGNVNDSFAGNGIGLATARHIVEQHGGEITVQSREGEGSTFTIRIPLQLQSTPSLQPPISSASAPTPAADRAQ